MATLPPSPETNLSPLISSPGDFPVRISAKPGNGLELKDLVRAFGLSSPASLGFFDPDSFLLRTWQAFLFQEQCPEWSESWPDCGMWDSGSVYELQISAPRISESACSSWPTPMQDDHTHAGRDLEHRVKTGRQITLGDSVRMWPTAAEDGESCGNHPGVVDSLTGAAKLWKTPFGLSNTKDYGGQSSGCGGEFAKQANQWQTPLSGNPKAEDGGNGGGMPLRSQTEQWQTPATDSFRSRGGDRKDEMGLDQQARFHDALLDPQTPDGPLSSPPAQTSHRRLNPRFVEWLMGFPISWTEL